MRVVHYLNQFFGGLGGEEHAQAPLEVREGPIGPGRLLQQVLGAGATVVTTLVCGDDYVAEREDVAGASMREALERYAPDLVLAGPAFDSGRYGLGCALACRVARSLGISAAVGMPPTRFARD
jgi:glycine reductase